MPKGVYLRKGNPELNGIESARQALIYDLEQRIAALEQRLEKANVNYLKNGYLPPSL